MAAHYQQHHVVCCPAMWEEPFGLTTLEARACRRVIPDKTPVSSADPEIFPDADRSDSSNS
jgi:glycosyltransferase involved in cell wall biosynthesis